MKSYNYISKSELLPLFSEDSKMVAMMRHAMKVIKDATLHVNPGQTPVVACNQLLFTLCKSI
jgi:hypothetical protein